MRAPRGQCCHTAAASREQQQRLGATAGDAALRGDVADDIATGGAVSDVNVSAVPHDRDDLVWARPRVVIDAAQNSGAIGGAG